jgi:hypothetical protein
MTMKTAKVGVLSIAALLGVCRLMAQAPLGAAALSGRIRDEQEAPVAAARVVLTEKSKGLVRESLSDNSGSFLFPSMSAGIYEVQVTKEGFSTHQVDDLKIDVGQRAALEITLRIGELRSVMTVASADASALDTESNVIGTVVDSGRVRDLPGNFE